MKPCKRTHTYSTQSTHGMAVPALQADPHAPRSHSAATAQAPLLAHTYTHTPAQTHTHTHQPDTRTFPLTNPDRHPSHTHTQSLQHNTDNEPSSPLPDASARPCACLHTSLAAIEQKRRHDRSVRSCTVPARSSPPAACITTRTAGRRVPAHQSC